MGHKVLTNTLFLLCGRIGSKIINFLFIFLVAHNLGNMRFGKFSFALAFAAIFSTISEFGLPLFIVRELSGDERRLAKTLRSIMALKLCLSLSMFVAMIAAIFLLRLDPADRLIVSILGLSVFIRSFSLPLRSIFTVRESLEYEALILILDAALSVCLGLLAITLNWGLLGISASQVAVSIAVVAFSIVVLARKFNVGVAFNVDTRAWSEIARRSWSFALMGVFSIVYLRTDIILLKFLKTDVDVGVYSAAYRVLEAVLFIPISYAQAILPVFSKTYKLNQAQMRHSFVISHRFLSYLSVGIVLVIFLLAGHLIRFLYGSQFADSAAVLRILIFFALPAFANNLLGSALIAAGHERIPAFVIGTGAAINILLNFVLVPRFSVYGAAIAALATETYAFVIQLTAVLRHLPAYIKLPEVLTPPTRRELSSLVGSFFRHE